MRTFYTLTLTEWLEAWKEWKIVWLPLFFIALGVTQPLLLMYMDVLLEHVGNADGIIVDPNRPAPQSLDVFSATIHGQFNQLGLIVLIMSFMGLLASDRQTGMQDFILTRPVSRNVYLLSKWFSHGMISLFGTHRFFLRPICSVSFLVSFGLSSHSAGRHFSSEKRLTDTALQQKRITEAFSSPLSFVWLCLSNRSLSWVHGKLRLTHPFNGRIRRSIERR